MKKTSTTGQCISKLSCQEGVEIMGHHTEVDQRLVAASIYRAQTYPAHAYSGRLF